MSSGMMPAQHFLTPDSYKQTFKSEVSGTLTNLPNIAGTWGKFIPTGWGNYRIGGYQIWSSPFYKITDTTTQSLVDNWATLNPSNMFQNALGMQNVYKGNEVYEERVSVDVAYSFGYNGLGGKCRVSRIRFDQNPIFDVNSGEFTNDYAFTIRYGNEDYPEPVMVSRASDPENVVYYPGQLVITFAGLEGAYLGTKNTKSPLPTSVDIDVIAISGPVSNGVMGDPLVRTYSPNQLDQTWGDSVIWRLANWEKSILYEYNRYSNPQAIRQYKLPSLEFIKEVPINVTAENGPNPFSAMALHQKSGLLCAQHDGPYGKGSGYSAVYIIDPDTGQQVDKFGISGYYFSAPAGAGIENVIQAQVFIENDNELSFMGGTNTSDRTSYKFGMRKSGGGWTAFGEELQGILPDRFSSWATSGKNGITYHHLDNDIYTGDDNGFTFAFTVPMEDFNLGNNLLYMSVVDKDLVIARGYKVIRYTKTGQKVYEKQYREGIEVPDNVYIADPWSTWYNEGALGNSRKQNNLVYGAYGNYYSYLLNLATGDMTIHPMTLAPGHPDINVWGSILLFDDVKGYAVDGKRNGIASSGFSNVPVSIEGERILLRDFIRSLYVNTGKYTPEQIEFVDIDDTIRGALLVKPYPLETVVNNTIKLYRIEKLETSNKIKFYRNRPIIGDSDIQYDIDLDNLALVREGDDSKAALVTTIGDTQKGFAEIRLTFIDYQADYNENSVVWRRPDAPADATETLDISTIIIMDKNEAQQLVQINFQDKISATTKHQLRLPPSYSDIYKGDILRVKHKKYTSVMRVTETLLNADHSVSVQADGAMLSINALPPITDQPNFTVGAALGKGPTIVIPLDINAIHPTHNFDDGFAYYYLVYGTDPEWAGGYVTRSNSKMTESRLFEVDRAIKFAAYETADVLTDKPWTLDEDILEVTKIGGNWNTDKNTTPTELAKSKTRNLCLYGAPGRWEIMQVASIVNGKASGFFRGMRGTESFCGLHVPGDKLLVIDEFLIAEKRPLDNVGITDTIKAVSYSEKFDQASGSAVQVKANALKPFAPVFIEGAKNADDIVFTWARRDRTGGSSFKPIPMSEATEKYELEIIKGNAVVRTVPNLTDKTFTYTAAMQTEDNTAGDQSLTLAVYQISAVVGRGYAGRALINVE